VQRDRFGTAVRFAQQTGCTVVLKGAGTIVAATGEIPAVNLTGNPGMATGGSGDVLAGLLAGLLAQGAAPVAAARAAVYLHGRAGDRAARRLSEAGLTAADLADEIACLFRELTGR
jgi:NAD(P)H-hydrate epimerase